MGTYIIDYIDFGGDRINLTTGERYADVNDRIRRFAIIDLMTREILAIHE